MGVRWVGLSSMARARGVSNARGSAELEDALEREACAGADAGADALGGR